MNQLQSINKDILDWWDENKEELEGLSSEAKKGVEDLYVKIARFNDLKMKHVSVPIGDLGKKLGFEDSECVDVWLEHGSTEPVVHFMLKFPFGQHDREKGILATARSGYVEESSWT